jgi:crossover junction endodeoxyribonuclease RusA
VARAEVAVTGGLRVITIEMPPGLPLPSLNDRRHWAGRAAAARELKDAACLMARGARLPQLQRAEVTVTYCPPDRRRRDPDNYAAAGKPLIDGLVAAGVLPDDDGRHVAAVHYRIGELYRLHPRGRIVITVREIATGDDSVSGD